MIVRLKECLIEVFEILEGRFQFYDSPIKRFPYRFAVCIQQQFQFYDSPIKRESPTMSLY